MLYKENAIRAAAAKIRARALRPCWISNCVSCVSDVSCNTHTIHHSLSLLFRPSNLGQWGKVMWLTQLAGCAPANTGMKKEKKKRVRSTESQNRFHVYTNAQQHQRLLCDYIGPFIFQKRILHSSLHSPKIEKKEFPFFFFRVESPRKMWILSSFFYYVNKQNEEE